MWPGTIRVPYLGTVSQLVGGKELIISNSGVPAHMDVILVAAFAIGINEVSPQWSLDGFNSNNQYAWGLRQAARFIVLAGEHGVDLVSIVDDLNWRSWFDRKNPADQMSTILMETYGDLFAH